MLGNSNTNGYELFMVKRSMARKTILTLYNKSVSLSRPLDLAVCLLSSLASLCLCTKLNGSDANSTC